MTEPKFLICKHCGNIVEKIHDAGVDIICCGEPMSKLVPNTTDGAKEKHVPDVKIDGNTVQVQVGSVPHPMLQEHYIGWILMVTKMGGQTKVLSPGDEPKATFILAPDDEAVSVYEWCNIHGLWKVDL